MTWKPTCPKCSSGSISIDRLEGTTWRAQDADYVLSCQACGKRIYGKVRIEATFHVQRKAWENDPEVQAAEAQRKKEADIKRLGRAEVERRMTIAAEHLRHRREEEAAQRAEQEEQKRVAWLEKVRVQDEDGPKPHADLTLCAWRSCENDARENSKYCSRKCSNRFAHWKAAQRKQAAGQAEGSSSSV